ncbi:MAG: elongation factor 1-beta [Euryarchaeota archaeon]|nr:elongation factor 1-beta [Euryarchaeota archaeon]MDE1835684.1 elongation factor 1-beta [Euryarchaeota archaeon]MDE1880454.1 elongation factor 1-beta [Euryarchaeota archaeon]MDE2043874.1 elongation factor 1-beta [Thermoplasmata archaeon]
MGSTVGLVVRVMPTGVDVDMKTLAEKAREAMPKDAKLRGMQVRDIAFGLKALLISVHIPDTGGLQEQVEKALQGVPHVESVEVIDTTLVQ